MFASRFIPTLRTVILLCAALLPFETTVAVAQQADTTQTLNVTSRLVVLDVVVTDKSGKPVSGLTRDDLRVYQDGAEQTIQHFDAHGATAGTDAPTGLPTVLVLDELNTPFTEDVYVHDQAMRFLAEQPAALASPIMILYIDDRGFHPLGPYSRDRDGLLNELRKHKAGLPGKLMRGASDEMIALSLSLLQQIAIASRGEPGRKLLLWVGRGFPGFDTEDLPEDRQELVHALIAKTSNLLTDSRITVSKIDPTIGTASTVVDVVDDDLDNLESLSASQQSTDSNFNFNTFVRHTGGQFLYGRNDLDKAIASYIQDESVYYTVSYVPKSAPADDAYQSIRIVMRDRTLYARTRAGLYPSMPQERTPGIKALGAELYEAAVSGIPYSGLSVRIASCKPHATGSLCHVKVDLAKVSGEHAPSGEYRIPIVAVSVLLDKKGKIASYKAERITESIPSSDKRPVNVGSIDLPLQVSSPSSGQSARIIIRDVSGRIGTAEIERP